jgi:hypothetical protein
VLLPFARLLRLASVIACLIVAASFTLFAVDKAQGASNHQQVLLGGGSGAPAAVAPAGSTGALPAGRLPTSSAAHESSVRRAIDDSANALTSPFSGLTSGSSSEWAVHLLKLVLALAAYGFGLGFLARVLRVRF